MRSSVDLPQPDGPTSTTNCPSAMSTLTPCTTWMAAVGLPQIADRDFGHVALAPRTFAQVANAAEMALSIG